MALPLLAIAAIGAGVASIGADMVHTSSSLNNTKRKRRGPSDYEATPFSVKTGALQHLDPLTPVKPVSPLYHVNNAALRPLLPVQPVMDPSVPRTRTIYKNPKFTEFTDPLQVNSLSDVLFNQEGRLS